MNVFLKNIPTKNQSLLKTPSVWSLIGWHLSIYFYS